MKLAPVALAFSLVVGCSPSQGGSSSGFSSDGPIVRTGASSSGDGWFFSVGNRFLKPGEPGLLFGVQQRPGGPRTLSYATLLRLPARGDGFQVMSSDVEVDYRDDVASLQDALTINDVEWELALTLEAGQVATLTLDGEGLDPAQGMLFLVDFRSSPVTHEQIDAALAMEPPVLDSVDLDSVETIEAFARSVIEELRSRDERVRAFLEE